MKILRLWLIVLLATVLPLRDAVAAAMLCPYDDGPRHSEVMGHHHQPSSASEADVGMPNGMEHEHAASGSHHHEESGSVTDKCNLCAASATAIAGGPPLLASPQEVGKTSYPAFASSFEDFLPDGQDRPPRTI